MLTKAYRLNNKYVLPKRRIKEFEKSYSEIEKEFEQLRQEMFNTLTSDWPRLVEDCRSAQDHASHIIHI